MGKEVTKNAKNDDMSISSINFSVLNDSRGEKLAEYICKTKGLRNQGRIFVPADNGPKKSFPIEIQEQSKEQNKQNKNDDADTAHVKENAQNPTIASNSQEVSPADKCEDQGVSTSDGILKKRSISVHLKRLPTDLSQHVRLKEFRKSLLDKTPFDPPASSTPFQIEDVPESPYTPISKINNIEATSVDASIIKSNANKANSPISGDTVISISDDSRTIQSKDKIMPSANCYKTFVNESNKSKLITPEGKGGSTTCANCSIQIQKETEKDVENFNSHKKTFTKNISSLSNKAKNQDVNKHNSYTVNRLNSVNDHNYLDNIEAESCLNLDPDELTNNHSSKSNHKLGTTNTRKSRSLQRRRIIQDSKKSKTPAKTNDVRKENEDKPTSQPIIIIPINQTLHGPKNESILSDKRKPTNDNNSINNETKQVENKVSEKVNKSAKNKTKNNDLLITSDEDAESEVENHYNIKRSSKYVQKNFQTLKENRLSIKKQNDKNVGNRLSYPEQPGVIDLRVERRRKKISTVSRSKSPIISNQSLINNNDNRKKKSNNNKRSSHLSPPMNNRDSPYFTEDEDSHENGPSRLRHGSNSDLEDFDDNVLYSKNENVDDKRDLIVNVSKAFHFVQPLNPKSVANRKNTRHAPGKRVAKQIDPIVQSYLSAANSIQKLPSDPSAGGRRKLYSTKFDGTQSAEAVISTQDNTSTRAAVDREMYGESTSHPTENANNSSSNQRVLNRLPNQRESVLSLTKHNKNSIEQSKSNDTDVRLIQSINEFIVEWEANGYESDISICKAVSSSTKSGANSKLTVSKLPPKTGSTKISTSNVGSKSTEKAKNKSQGSLTIEPIVNKASLEPISDKKLTLNRANISVLNKDITITNDCRMRVSPSDEENNTNQIPIHNTMNKKNQINENKKRYVNSKKKKSPDSGLNSSSVLENDTETDEPVFRNITNNKSLSRSNSMKPAEKKEKRNKAKRSKPVERTKLSELNSKTIGNPTDSSSSESNSNSLNAKDQTENRTVLEKSVPKGELLDKSKKVVNAVNHSNNTHNASLSANIENTLQNDLASQDQQSSNVNNKLRRGIRNRRITAKYCADTIIRKKTEKLKVAAEKKENTKQKTGGASSEARPKKDVKRTISENAQTENAINAIEDVEVPLALRRTSRQRKPPVPYWTSRHGKENWYEEALRVELQAINKVSKTKKSKRTANQQFDKLKSTTILKSPQKRKKATEPKLTTKKSKKLMSRYDSDNNALAPVTGPNTTDLNPLELEQCVTNAEKDKTIATSEEHQPKSSRDADATKPQQVDRNMSDQNLLFSWLLDLVESNQSEKLNETIDRIRSIPENVTLASLNSLTFHCVDGVEYSFYSNQGSNHDCGYMKFRPNTEKKRCRTKQFELKFLCLTGELNLIIDGIVAVIHAGDFFTLHKGTQYQIINKSSKPAVLFTMKFS